MIKLLFENKRYILSTFLTILMVFCAHISGYADITPVQDRTPQIRDAIVAAVPGVNSANDVTAAHLAAIITLECSKKSISALKSGDFSGLTALTTLDLSRNTITDISTLANLTTLTTLNLNHNAISDISVLKKLTKLRWLYLSHNALSDISALTNLTALKRLWLGGNAISDISALEKLTKLTTLNLAHNAISDISVLEKLTSLTALWLDGNSISDVSVLEGLTSLVSLHLSGNPISDYGPLRRLKAANPRVSIDIDINNAPVFTAGTSTTLTVAENTASGTNIGSAIAATDADNDTLTYTLGGTDADSFRIVSTSGQLQTNAALDYETKSSYSVTVSVSDENDGSDSIAVTVNVTDVNEAPSFPTKRATRSVAENTVSSTNIGTPFQATDPDNGDTLTYSLHRGDAASFRINASTGQLRTHSALDFETKKVYNDLVIRATDSEGNFDAIFVTINVTDVNETPVNNAPNFTDGSSTTRSIAENTDSGENIGSAVAATDADNHTLTYTLGGTDASSFSIVSTSGQLQTSAALNYESKSSYSVSVSVSDNNGGSDSIDVTISVTDVNEAPSFASSTATRSIAENTASGQNIGSPVTATDVDANTTLTYTLGGTDAASFGIVSTTGQLQTSAALNYESKTSYSVTVTASDGSLSDTIAVTISVTNVNEAPTFATTTATRSVAENTATNQNIGAAFTATDVDSGNTITYSIPTTGDAAAFSIDSNTGQLKTKDALNYEDKNAYTVVVTASDGSLSDTITVTISVTNVNETPTFATGTTISNISATNGTAITSVTLPEATDPDANTTLTYTLTPALPAGLTFTTSTRVLSGTPTAVSDSATYTYTASDSNLSDTLTFTIQVNAPANNPPTFTDGDSTTRSVAENTASGQNIGTAVAATDTDNDTLTYTLGGDDAASFSIVSTTGQLQTSAALDRETKSSYSVTITADDGNTTNNTDSIAVTVNVTDVNEKPSFNIFGRVTLSVAENTASGTNIGDPFQATDPDSGDTLTYSLQRADKDAFSIDANTGQLKTRAALDYETKRTYNDLAVRATDSQGLVNSVLVTINVTNVNENRAPAFTDGTSTTRSIAENTNSNTNIGAAVSATDADNDTLTYTLSGADASMFSIVSTSGQLRTNAALDYETKTSYAVSVSVSDRNGGSDSITVTINVTDVNETPIPSVSDRTAAVRDAIVAAVPGVSNANDVTIAHLAAITSLNLANKSISSLKTGDFNGLTALTSLDLNNNSISDISALSNLTSLTLLDLNNNSISDISALSGMTSMVTLTLSNNSISDISNLSGMTSMDTLALMNNSVSDISPVSSMTRIVVLNMKNNNIGDVSPLSGLTSLFIVSLAGNPISNYGPLRTLKAANPLVILDININNNPPVFTDGTSTTRSVTEGTATGTNIGDAVAATDADNHTLTYTLGGTDAASFRIVSTSGQLQTNAALDYETKSSYAVTITVYDGNSGGDSISVTINVTEVKENNAPAFTDGTSATRSVAENTTSDTNIGTAITATDADTSDTLTYTLSGTDAASFSIISTSGQLQTSAALNYETKSSYAVSVSVSDGNGGTDSIAVTINVTDVNEKPIFSTAGRVTRSVAENTAANTNIGTPFQATDPDSGDTLTYSLQRADKDAFRIDARTGQLKTHAALDYETKRAYSDLAVRATDSQGLVSSVLVTVNVTDINENRAPAFTDGTSTTRSIAENTASEVNIGSAVAATDADTSDTLTYTLGGTDASSFSIVSTSGQLQTSAALDFETTTSYSVSVSVSDSNGGSDSIPVTITVTNVNEAPSFANSTATRSIAENTASGEDIGSAVAATDPDSGNTLTYSLGGTDAASFSIVSTSGQLQTNVALDHETKASYSVTVTATDGDNLSDTINVTISVTDVNEAPNFATTTATRSIAENTASGEDIGAAVVATDVDDDTLTYTLGGTDAASFSIVSTSGQLQTNVALDHETKASYSVTVTAADGGNLSDTISVTISVTNVNEAPNFATTTATRSIAENTTSGENIGSAVAATDPDTGDTLTYTLGGTDASSFSIVSTSGQLRTNAALNFESKISYSVTVTATDGGNLSDTITVTISVTNVNEAPNFTEGSSATRSVAENTAANTNIGSAVAATDVDANTTLTYTLGGTDAASFSIVSTSGQLRTNASLDYETKSSYAVTVSVSDGNGGNDSIAVTVDITDVAEITPPLSDRTTQVRDAIVAAVPGVSNADDVTIAHLAAITSLDLSNKSISALNTGDFNGLAALTRLDLSNNSISDISALSGMTSMVTLNMKNNNVSDVSTLSGLTSLFIVTLAGNPISDYGPLRTLKAAIPFLILDIGLTNNPPVFTEGASTTRSVAERTVSGTNIGAAVAATDANNHTLTYTLSGADADAFSIVSTSGQLQTKAALDYETKNAYTVTVTVYDGNSGGGRITVTINVIEIPPVNERTAQVRDAIVAAVPGVSNANDVTIAHLAAITSLNLSNRSISALKTGDFSGLTALSRLNLSRNSISDISAVENLTALTRLDLSRNSISDISAIEDLTSLTTLYLNNNSISDISAVENLTALTRLNLNHNSVSDISALEDLTALTSLNLSRNSISGISALEDLTALTSLNLNWNRISDISALEDLTALTSLNLSRNSISDISALEDLTALTSLNLSDNSLSDISVLEDLTALISLNLNWNRISDISALEDLTSLTSLDLSDNSLSDISALEDLTSLIRLYLVNNPIPLSAYGPLRRLKAAIDAIEEHPGLKLDLDLTNNPPVFTDGTSTTRTVAENTAFGTNIGTAVAATDTEGDTLTYTLGGTDADSFSIVNTSGQLQTIAVLDFETKASYTVTVDVSDGNGLDRITVTINVTDVVAEAPSVLTPPALPETTALLPNFPNPFNPETWIPYQLAKPAAVTITIYDVRGRVVRTLLLGNQPAGMYRNRSKAAHWDGRNQLGEKVATGVYFYTLKAGNYMTTRKLLIRK